MTARRILITGARGMLGRDLMAHFTAQGDLAMGLDSVDCNLRWPLERLRDVIAPLAPDVILHAAALTDVDRAEREPALAMAINAEGSGKIALLADALGCALACVSTDFVFDGRSDRPYTPQDAPNPVNVYGRSKYEGEKAAQQALSRAQIIRTSWLYGVHGRNFTQFVLESVRQGRALSLVCDWTGSPTWTGSLAVMIDDIITRRPPGVYHAADQGAVSKYEQALTICRAAGLATDLLRPTPASALSFSAPRPAYSVLACAPLTPPPWESSLAAYLRQETQARAVAESVRQDRR